MCVVETQIEGARVEALAGTLGFDNSYAVSSQGLSGGIGLFWNNSIKVEILGYYVYHLDVSVEEQASHMDNFEKHQHFERSSMALFG